MRGCNLLDEEEIVHKKNDDHVEEVMGGGQCDVGKKTQELVDQVCDTEGSGPLSMRETRRQPPSGRPLSLRIS